MAQQPFTAAGVAAKETELNNMTAAQRQNEAGSISSDFRTWLGTNFSLSTDQSNYLTGMSDQWIAYAAYLTSFAVINQLPIDLTQHAPTSGSDTLKLIHITNNIDCLNESGVLSITGGVSFVSEWTTP